MDWNPSTDFEDDLVDLQSNYNILPDEPFARKWDFNPRPKSTYEFLANREKRNAEKDQRCPKSKEITASLAMMERIQKIAGTKPLGELVSLSDWDDKSTVEKEAVAMMRHFGMLSMADGLINPEKTEAPPPGSIHIIRNGRQCLPLILDPSYFEPGKKREACETNVAAQKINQPDCNENFYEGTEFNPEELADVNIRYKVLDSSASSASLNSSFSSISTTSSSSYSSSSSSIEAIKPLIKKY